MTIHRSVMFGVIALALNACGGSSSAPVAPAAVRAASAAMVTGTLTLSFANAATASATRRSPKFVSAAASSASISVDGGTATIYDVSSTSTLCTGVTARTCALSLSLPVGQDSIAVTLFDAPNATGHTLGAGSNSVTVVAGSPFSITVGINPMIASIGTVTGGSSFTNGTAGSITVTITFDDPAGAPITGSGNVPNFTTPVTLTSSTPDITISPATLTTPGQTVTLSYNGSATAPASATISLFLGTALLQTFPISINAASPITTFTIPTAGSSPFGIVAGPDGNLWFVENVSNKIGRITTAGAITEFPIPTASANAAYIVNGPDGALWFAEDSNIGRITTSGAITEFPTMFITPVEITNGPDGNLWFTTVSNGIGRITTSGTVTTFAAPFNVKGIVTGPDGNLWFCDPNNNKIGRMTTSGVVTEYAIPTASSSPYQITNGPDGNLWATEETTGGRILRITTAGVITEFTIPDATAGDSFGIVTGSDNNLYIAIDGQLAALNPLTQTSTLYNGSAFFTANGPDNAIWYTDISHNTIGRLQL